MSRRWIEINGLPTPLWVPCNECRLANGDLAFDIPAAAIEQLPVPPWFDAPANSRIRQQFDMRAIGLCLREIRSMQAGAEEILTFYRNCSERGGLVRTSDPQGVRTALGFRAENARESLAIDLYEHKGSTFWTVELVEKGRVRGALLPAKVVVPRNLVLVERDHGRATLREPYSGKEYWVPAQALTDVEPDILELEPKPAGSVIWSSLPEWVQFGIDAGSEGEASIRREPGRVRTWEAGIGKDFDGDHRLAFDSCLDSLDARRFDASGAETPDRSYFVEVSQSGRSLRASIHCDADDRAEVTLLNTLGRVRMVICYYRPVPGQIPDRRQIVR
jgi:hypothetical protein